jgi:formate dehydrogenase subunit gamma
VTLAASASGRLSDERLRAIVAEHRHERGALLPILHAVLEEAGAVEPGVVDVLAHELNLSRAEVHGVISFYPDFRRAPAGRVHVRICRAEACQAVGAEALWAHAREATGLDEGVTAADGSTTLDRAFCFGNCALGPSVEVNGTLHGRVTPTRLDALLEGGR